MPKLQPTQSLLPLGNADYSRTFTNGPAELRAGFLAANPIYTRMASFPAFSFMSHFPSPSRLPFARNFEPLCATLYT